MRGGSSLSLGSDSTALGNPRDSNDKNLKSGEDHVFFEPPESTNASSDRALKKPGVIVRENRGSKGEGTPSIEGGQGCSASSSLRASRPCGGLDQEPRPSENDVDIAETEHPAVHLLGDMLTSSSVHMNEQTISRSSVTPPDRLPMEIVHNHFASNALSSADVTTFAHPQIKQSVLDLKAAFLPLIPQFPVASADIRVWIHSVTFPLGVRLAKPPYVRASLHPGTHRVTCTGLSRDPVSSTECNAKRYLFKENVALQLGVEEAQELAQGCCLPIMLRLQAVSNRLLGSCDVSLLEALRRPGSVFQQINMPIWRTVPNGRSGQVKRSIPTTFFRGQQLTPPEVQTDRVVSGYIAFDFGVILKQEESKIPALKLDRTRAILHAGIVEVSVTGLRRNLVSESDLGWVAGTVQCAGILGVSAALGSSSQNIIATFDISRPGFEKGHWLPTAAVSGLHCADGSLVSKCMELDTLVLRLVYLKESSATGRWMGRDGTVASHSPIPISDINTIFNGGTHWLKMSLHASRHRKRKIIEKSMVSTTETAGRDGWDVCLRVAVSMEAPDDRLQLCEGSGPKQASPRSSSALEMSQYSVRCTESTYLNCEDWILAQRSDLEQAQAVLSSQPKGQSRYDETVMASTDVRSGSIQGPGYLDLELLAIHGNFVEAEARNGMLGDLKSSPRFWVRASFSGGSDGIKVVESSDLILGDRYDGQGAGRDAPAGNHKITRWPLSTVMVIKYALNWSPRQRILPMASFHIFHQEVSQDPTRAKIVVNSDNSLFSHGTFAEKSSTPHSYPSSCYYDYLLLSGLLDEMAKPYTNREV